MSDFIFCFIDESENREKRINYYLVLTGILVHSEYLFDCCEELEKLKKDLKLRNLKLARNTKKLKREEKLEITKKLVKILKKYGIKIISIVEIPNKLKKNTYDYKRKKLYFDAVWFLSERVTLYAKRNKLKWIFVADALPYKPHIIKELKKNIRSKVRLKGEAFKTKIGNYLFETPFFTEDDLSNFVQVADLVALSLNSGIKGYLSKNGCPIKVDDLKDYCDYLAQYWNLFDRSPKGELDGWGIKLWWYNE